MPLPTYIFDANRETPESLAKRRALAEAMLQRGSSGVASNPWEGLAQLGEAIAGRISMSRADGALKKHQGSASDMFRKMLTGNAGNAGNADNRIPASPAPQPSGSVPGGNGAVALPGKGRTEARDWLNYANQGATRNQPLSSDLEKRLAGVLPELGVTMKVFSGGQDATGPNRTGSHRHDHGNSADAFFFKDGRKLDWSNPQDVPLFQEIVRRSKAAGVTGFGAGQGYMQPGSMHIGLGKPAIWGSDMTGATAPGWLRDAYNGGGGSNRLPGGAGADMLRQPQTVAPGKTDARIGMSDKGVFEIPAGASQSPSAQAFAGQNPPVFNPNSPPPAGPPPVSNAEYFKPFGEAITPMARSMVPKGLLAPFDRQQQPAPPMAPAPQAMPQQRPPQGIGPPQMPMPQPMPQQAQTAPSQQAAPVQPAMAPPPQMQQPQKPMTAYQRMTLNSLGKESGANFPPDGLRALQSGSQPSGINRPGNGSSSFPGQPPMQAAMAPQAASMQQGGSRLAQLEQAISSPDFPWAEPWQQKMLVDMYQREVERANPDPRAAIELETAQIKLDELKNPKPGYRVMTPQEKQQLGIPPNAQVQMSPDGKLEVLSDLMKPREPPKTRDFVRGNKRVTQEWNDASGTFKDISEGDAFKTTPDVMIGSGVKEEKIFDETKARADSARAAATGLSALGNAGQALPGAITGAGANERLALQKVASLLGVGDTEAISDTETFRSAIAPQVAAMMKATVGSTQISNADREFAEKAAAGAITLDASSIGRLLNIMKAANSEIVRKFNVDLNAVYPEGQGMDRERALFSVPNVPHFGASQNMMSPAPQTSRERSSQTIEQDGYTIRRVR